MTTFLTTLLSYLVSALFFFNSLIAPQFGHPFEAKDKENVRCTIAAMSDIHLQADDAARLVMLKEGFKNLSDSGYIDAVISAGDMTDHGEPEQYDAFYKCVQDSLKGPQFIPAIGNHDTWGESLRDSDPTYNFVSAYNKYFDEKIDKAYYSTEVNGYTVICMATDEDSTRGHIPDEEIVWLDAELAKAAEKDKPIFVICHWTVTGANGQDEIWPEKGDMGDASDKVEAVLNKYKNVFFISGHLHEGLRGEAWSTIVGHSSIETIGNVHYINLPSYMFFNTEGYTNFEGGYLPDGYGYIIEIYDDCVAFRARNIALGHWMPNFDKTIELV
ncbi:MAG: metallophosphoesterase family protein [Acutalibacteraceae bacterium]